MPAAAARTRRNQKCRRWTRPVRSCPVINNHVINFPRRCASSDGSSQIVPAIIDGPSAQVRAVANAGRGSRGREAQPVRGDEEHDYADCLKPCGRAAGRGDRNEQQDQTEDEDDADNEPGAVGPPARRQSRERICRDPSPPTTSPTMSPNSPRSW